MKKREIHFFRIFFKLTVAVDVTMFAKWHYWKWEKNDSIRNNSFLNRKNMITSDFFLTREFKWITFTETKIVGKKFKGIWKITSAKHAIKVLSHLSSTFVANFQMISDDLEREFVTHRVTCDSLIYFH